MSTQIHKNTPLNVIAPDRLKNKLSELFHCTVKIEEDNLTILKGVSEVVIPTSYGCTWGDLLNALSEYGMIS